MTVRIDRRSFLLTGTLGLGAFAIPGFAQTATVAAARGFTHAVASGEPGTESMLLWTRYVASGDSAKLRVEVSESGDFAKIVAGGEAITGPWRDWTAKITVTGLKPGTRYHYRFIAPDGTMSPVGRTRTLPQGDISRFGIAIFSCSNIGFGYFNAYAHAAVRDDIDLAVHLGDYIYEYPHGFYPTAAQLVDSRLPLPATEILHLADYRLRYASYRSDPDLQALHTAKPMLIQWDDHEAANDAWEGGAQNHMSATEGEWSIRRAAAIQAWREWMPVSDEPWKSYQIGRLATLFRTETRLGARTRPPSAAPLLAADDPVAALKAFRDGAWQDPAMTMMGWAQEAWIAAELARSVKAGTHWQVAGFGTIMGRSVTPKQAVEWLRPDAPESVKRLVTGGVKLAALGLPMNLDNWGGYPAARARFLKAAQAANANLVVIAGDSHNAWAFDLAQDGKPAGVEFAGHAVTSPGYEGSTAADPKVIAAALVETNRELTWSDTSQRGYMALTLTPQRVRNDWIFVDTVLQRTPSARIGHSAVVLPGRRIMA
ncbi:alkaline phosphatase D family protein [Sphingomonas sp. LT1P40]|uniref:alkaline phosphatase D family protein n=1 Tax=Alteristakelama amylovorans TaxID=3096166 RepID=UPI002FC58799